MVNKIGIGIMVMAMLGGVQAALRTFFGMGGAGALGLAMRDQVLGLIETPVGNETLVIVAPFLLLGLLGAAATAGMALRRPWGYYGTAMVSVATIAYDLWAALAIQSSAVIGLLVPVIMLVLLSLRKERFVTSWAVST